MPNARLQRTREAYQDDKPTGRLVAEPVGKTGIAIRFIREYDASVDRDPRHFDVWMPKKHAEFAVKLDPTCEILEPTEDTPWAV